MTSVMNILFLGTGTSTGVPQIGCSCAVCTSPDPRNRRLRSSIYVEAAGTQLGALELFAEELRLAQEELGTITGEFSADDLLGVIFSRFCIGK